MLELELGVVEVVETFEIEAGMLELVVTVVEVLEVEAALERLSVVGDVG